MIQKIVILTILLLGNNVFAQNGKDCVNEVVLLNELNDHKNDTALKDKSVRLSYSVRVTDWEDETTISNVKVYKKNYLMHFFSEQVNVYQDDREVLLILPLQKVALLNNNDKRLTNVKMTDAFFEMRNSFLDSCEVISCSTTDKNNKVLILKVIAKKVRDDIKITKITYEYNMEQKKIISVKLDYQNDYKLKQMLIVYKEFMVGAEYSFYPAKSYILDKKGNLLPKYKTYEFVDNRDKKSNSK
ncbi:MAG: hypothetical protein ABIP51_06540 [Bacteroidia bacterium]